MDLARRAAFLLLGSIVLGRTYGSLLDIEPHKLQSLDYVRSDEVPLGARAVSTGREGTEGSLFDLEASTTISPEYDHRLLQDSRCIEYSDIMTYCCGATARQDCEAAGGPYSGPQDACEVVTINVLSGPPSCTGLGQASGLFASCECDQGPTPDPNSSGTSAPTSAPSSSNATVGAGERGSASAPGTDVSDGIEADGSTRRASPGAYLGVAVSSLVVCIALGQFL